MMADKPFHEMTDDELRAELEIWEDRVDSASGWAAAYFAAKCLEAIIQAGNERGLELINRFPIRRG
jgi:hypothetical protein